MLGTFTIGDVAYQAFVPNGVETPDHCLIYGINSSGTIGFYIYDALDGTFQRYRFEDTSQIVIPEKEEEKEPEKEPDTKEEKALTPSESSPPSSDPFTMWLMIGLGALVLILLRLAVVFIVLYRKKAALRQPSRKKAHILPVSCMSLLCLTPRRLLPCHLCQMSRLPRYLMRIPTQALMKPVPTLLRTPFHRQGCGQS